MNIVLGSAFRNAEGKQITKWLDQCISLWIAWTNKDFNFRLIAVEGDSTDNTREQLLHQSSQSGLRLDLITCNHGQRIFGSTEEADRLSALSQVGNAILSGVNESDDILIYVESDLLWSEGVMIKLIDRVMTDGYDVVAPLVFAGDNFYDIFVYRGLDGERFSPFPPYHHSLWNDCQDEFKIKPVEVSSAGSCLVMKAEVARRCRIRNNQALLGFCEDVREKGYHIWVYSTQRIYHP